MQKSTILVGLLGAGLAIALVTTIGSLATFAETQSSNNIGQSSGKMPIMQDNTGIGMMDGTNMMPGDTNQQQQMMKGNMGSMMGMMSMMMNMMSMGDMMQGHMMGNGKNMNMMNSTMSMQDMMDQMMGSNYVHMGMNRFMPSDMRTTVGTTVTWQNHDHVVHNVVGVFKTDAGAKISVRSPDLSHMDSWSYTFNEAGRFEYVCSYHESQGMKGRILISP